MCVICVIFEDTGPLAEKDEDKNEIFAYFNTCLHSYLYYEITPKKSKVWQKICF